MPDLKSWAKAGALEPAGVLGGNYECPDLVPVPAQGGEERWVLSTSISPGASWGGSTAQCFVGSLGGSRFTPDDAATRFVDFGKVSPPPNPVRSAAVPVHLAASRKRRRRPAVPWRCGCG